MMRNIHLLTFVFIVLVVISIGSGHLVKTNCESTNCNSTSPHCNATTRKCERGYYLCCDQLCHGMYDPCPNSSDTKVNHMYNPTLHGCDSHKCNSTDPNCDAIGRRCKEGFRICCDHICRDKQESCDNIRQPVQQRFSFLQDLNRTQYQLHLKKVQETIEKYISENPCWPSAHCLNETTCKPEYVHCDNGQCVHLLSECPIWWETNDFSNPSNRSCYPNELCFRNQCRAPYWMCDDGECVYKEVVCRGGADCSDGSDENYCSGSCYPPFKCENDTCKFGFFPCNNGKCILQEQVCDTVKDCPDGKDELNCSTECYPEKACNPNGTCKTGYFRCDKAKCIPDSSLCDQRANCDDGSDEIKRGPGFKCVIGSNDDTCLIGQDYVIDDVLKCTDHADACVTNGTNRCFECLDERLIVAEKQRCDGVFDCYDLSDECFCEHSKAQEACKSICVAVNSISANHSRMLPPSLHPYILPRCNCSVGSLDCGNGICVDPTKICDGVRDCGASGLDEKFCLHVSEHKNEIITCPGDPYNTTTVKASLCDGRPECHDLSDECNEQCDSTPRFCNIKTLFNSKAGPYEFLCDKTSLFFDVRLICDGKWTACQPRIEEEELDCPHRYYCKCGDAISIDKNLLCDGIPQCDDASDETNCSDRFYCENQIPLSVPLSKKLDGKPDCSDSSDECPRDMDDNALSSRRELLEALGFRSVTWIIGSMAFLGNVITFIGAAKCLIQRKSLNRVSRTSYIFLVHLSVADCLMGVYLLSLLVRSLGFSGRYCMYDKLWRTSWSCASLGSLALVSSQTSVFILICLTTLRLYSVINPTKTKQIPTLLPHIVMLFVWSTSIALAVLPSCTQLADYFISDVWMPTNFTNMEFCDRVSLAVLAIRLSSIQPSGQACPDSFCWRDLTLFITKNYPNFKIKGFFGYFSDNSVCLPKFFASVGETGWEYSIGIIMFNFAAFLYICFAYWFIFKVSSSKQAKRKRSKQLEKMQRRISRLVATDFCCWIPICILSFVQLGGINLPNQAYAYCAVILLPINSAINPFLYSNTLARPLESLYNKLCCKRNQNMLPICLLPKKEDLTRTRSLPTSISRNKSDETEEKVL